MTETTRYLLPPEAYFESAWLDAERRQLFERAWVFAGVEHDVAEPGDYLTVAVGRAPVVVVRGADGDLRAFHNACRHRGLPLVDGDGSCGRALVCPYHRWNYGLDGSLRSVPQRDQFPDLDRESLGLVGVRVDVWKTLIFVTLDDQIEPLEEWMAGLDSLFPNFHPDQLVEVSDQLHEVQSNWKLYVENHVDWLHLWYLHADSLGHYNHGAGRRHEFGRHWASFEYVSDKVDQGDTAADDATNGDVESSPVADVAEDGLLPIPGLSDSEAGNGAHFVFPALTLFTNDVYWMLGQVIPVDATSFRLRLRVFAVEGSDGAAFEPIVNVVMHEDYSVTEAIQRVVASPLFSVGPMAASYEHQIMRFHQHYLDFVSPPGRGTE